jgi:ATP-dependent Lon protease
MPCLYIFKRGPKKGTRCDEIPLKKSKYCLKHNKLNDASDDEYNEPDELKSSLTLTPASKKVRSDSLSKKKQVAFDLQKRILSLNTSDQNKNIILKHFKNTLNTDQNSSEYYKNKLFIDQSLAYPWDRNFDIKKVIGNQNIANFITNLKNKLDEEIFGMDDVKNEFVNIVCKFITNPNSNRNNIALYGAAGVGKNRFVKVLSETIGLPMKEISLGGIKDSSFFLGHGYVYVESGPGKIIQNIIDSKVSNPIIYFDELDKVSETDNGKDIYSFLTYLTDSSQNNQFTDHYFYGMKFDLSRVFYIFTFNDITKIDKILLDRLNVIYIRTPTENEIITILDKYCIPEIINNIGITKNINFTKSQLKQLINQYKTHFDNKVSSGIRLYYRVIEKILLEVNKDILTAKYDHLKNISFDTDSFNLYLDKTKAQFITDNDADNSFLSMYT